MAKALGDSFADWESHVFGCGYGTGEPHVLAALKVTCNDALSHPNSKANAHLIAAAPELFDVAMENFGLKKPQSVSQWIELMDRNIWFDRN